MFSSAPPPVKNPTSSAVAKKSAGSSNVNTKIQGMKMSLESLEPKERTYIQTMVSQSSLVNDIFLEHRMKTFGTPDYKNSPLYKEFELHFLQHSKLLYTHPLEIQIYDL